MTDPARVRGFLDLAGDWNPTLAFVLAGAVGTSFAGYRLLGLRDRPLYAERYDFPTARRIDPKLLLGALLFGVGWGLVGLCPGPAIADLTAGSSSIILFVGAMLAGMALFHLTAKRS
jgi:uncharacterized membrane protein YedE/YeeE